MKRSTLAIGAIALIAAIGGVLFGMQRFEPAKPADHAVHGLLSQTLPDAAGAPQALQQWQGKLLVVNFWATWCPPCVKEMPALSALQAELAGKVQFLGIGIDNADNISEFIKKTPVAYPILVAGMGGAKPMRELGNTAGGLPFTVVIGADGQVRKTYLGEVDIARLRQDLAGM